MVADERLPHVVRIEKEVSNRCSAGSQQEHGEQSTDDQYG
jgi:hypothetical protein